MAWEFIKTDTMPPGGVKNLPTTVLAFVWYFASQVKWQLGAIAACFAVSSLLFVLLPYGVKMIVEAYEQDPHFTTPSAFYSAIFLFIGFYILRISFEMFGDFLCARSVANFSNFVRMQIMLYASNHSLRFFQDDFAGRIANKVIETPSRMRDLVFTVLDRVVYAAILIVGMIGVFGSADAKYALILACWGTLYLFIISKFIPVVSRKTQYAAKEMNIQRGRMIDNIVNILQVKLFARQTYENKVLTKLSRENALNWNDRDMADWRMSSSIYLSLVIMVLVSIFFVLDDIKTQSITTGDVSMILTGLIFISNNGVWVSKMFSELFKTYGEIYEGIDLITAAHEVLDAPSAPALHITRGDITLDHVHFAYPGRLVFPDLSMHIPPGQKVGLVGPSGAGKSTLVLLLLRLYDIQSGSIQIDGQNIADVQQDTLRAGITVIPQNSDLLHRSIRDNIAYGRLDATEDEIMQAARMSHAHDFILQLTDKDSRTGYDAQVGERGVKLSGGQRQRIAIARAILKDAPILLLDEATSALDSESEALIQKSLFDVMKNRTVVAIAHRLSTIQHMDRLLVMKDGQIIEDGSHAELLARNGYYASLWARQAGGFLNL
jgi:ATP-binding cassette subfamily B multidrug efflux pump